MEQSEKELLRIKRESVINNFSDKFRDLIRTDALSHKVLELLIRDKSPYEIIEILLEDRIKVLEETNKIIDLYWKPSPIKFD